MRRVLIVGATSAIAEATARRFAADGDRLYLVARNADKLAAVASDLEVRGASQVATEVMDATDVDRHAGMIETAEGELGGLDTVLIAHGTLPDQAACQASVARTREALETNAWSVIALLTELANRLEARGHGTIAVIGSVAGDRGRQSNYVYGTAKAAVATFAQGLRNRLHRSRVHVLTVKPGFVDTPMTRAFDKNPLWVSPDHVARQIHAGIEKRRDVIYTPRFWWAVMTLIRAIPEWVFKRGSL